MKNSYNLAQEEAPLLREPEEEAASAHNHPEDTTDSSNTGTLNDELHLTDEQQRNAKYSFDPETIRIALALSIATATATIAGQFILIFMLNVVPTSFQEHKLLLFVTLVSDGLIALAYMITSVSLLLLVIKRQRDVPFFWMFLLFSLFIISCGITHLLLLYAPYAGEADYALMHDHSGTRVAAKLLSPTFTYINAVAKLATAIVSFATAVAAICLLPLAVQLPTPEQIRLTAKVKLQAMMLQLRNAYLEQRYVAKSSFLSILSHEVRTPLNGILGMIELLKDTKLDEFQKYHLNAMDNSSKLLIYLLDSCLDFSKLESGKMELEYRPFNLHKTIRKSVDLFKLNAYNKNVALSYDIHTAVPEYCIGDKLRLSYIIYNLISNALKYSFENGTVDVFISLHNGEERTELPQALAAMGQDTQVRQTSMEPLFEHKSQRIAKNGECDPDEGVVYMMDTRNRPIKLLIRIRDCGTGIPALSLKRLFYPFSQAHGVGSSIHTRSYGGSGLGLSLSSALVKLMNGYIWVSSEVGKGSQFSFTIVVSQVTQDDIKWLHDKRDEKKQRKQVLKAATAGLLARDKSAVSILLADDNPTNYTIAVTLLKKLGYTNIKAVDDGAECVEEFERKMQDDIRQGIPPKEAGYRLCLLDVYMPKMSGPEAAKRIRRLTGTEGTFNQAPFIVSMTASPTEDVRAICKEAGMNSFLAKPFRVIQLYDIVNKYTIRTG